MEDNQREISNNLFVDQDKVKLLSKIVQQKRLGKLKSLVKSKKILEWIQMNTEIEKLLVIDDLDLNNEEVERD